MSIYGRDLFIQLEELQLFSESTISGHLPCLGMYVSQICEHFMLKNSCASTIFFQRKTLAVQQSKKKMKPLQVLLALSYSKRILPSLSMSIKYELCSSSSLALHSFL